MASPIPLSPPLGIAGRLLQVEERIQRACDRTGRRRADVQLVAVSKVFPAAAILEAHAAGLREFGENYVQEFEGKASQVRHLTDTRFHLIGHLQSNKSRRAAELFDVIQTVDSMRLARRLEETGRPLEVMIEVKLSSEESKSGASPEELEPLVAALRASQCLRLTGLMTMPPWSENPEDSRSYFRQLRELAARYDLPRLSMGMSHDLEVAIEEGATIVRVGTALFGSRRRPA